MSGTEIPLDAIGQLEALARRLRDNPAFMASVLTIYQRQERLNDAGLVLQLKTTRAMLTRLELCKRPDSSSPNFADQVRQIAAYTNVDAAQLAAILRQVESLGTLSARPRVSTTQEASAQQMQLRPGLLAAARDRGGLESDQPPSPDEENNQKTE